MGHKSRVSLGQQVCDMLKSKEGFGRSKKQDKALGLTDRYIYSFTTMRAYLKHCHYFIDWCQKNAEIRRILGRKPRTLGECRPYVSNWLNSREEAGLSAYTIKLEHSALCKLYGESLAIQTKATRRADIKRSRGAVARDAHFSETANADLVNACRHVGFRRSELVKCKPDDLLYNDAVDQWYVLIKGKGGRYRLAPVLDNDQRTLDYIRTLNGHNKVHSAADIHSYRADYATSIYNAHKGDLNALKGQKINYTEITGKRRPDGSEIVKSAVYRCRDDRKGVVLDRYAMLKASEALGHNRESVVGEHYINLT